MEPKLLIVHRKKEADEIAESFRTFLPETGFTVLFADTCEKALYVIKNNKISVALLYYNLTDINCESLIDQIKSHPDPISIAVLTDEGNRELAIKILEKGVDEYVTNKYGINGICLVLKKVLLKKIVDSEVDLLQDELKDKLTSRNIQLEEMIKQTEKNVEDKNNKMSKILEIGKSISSNSIVDDLILTIIEETTKILDADRSTLFLYDKNKNELWSKIAEKSTLREIRFDINTGIAGYVTRTKKIVNINNAYVNTLFDPDFDKKTGFHTESVLCAPMEGKDGNFIGVIEALNKKNGKFTKEDEDIIRTFASLVAILIENAKLTKENLDKERMATIGDMASTIVHDLKNPMSTIRGYAQMMLMQSSDFTKPANIIMHEIDRLTDMAHELLEFSKGVNENINIESINSKEFFSEVCDFIEMDLRERKIDFKHSIRYVGEIEINPDKIRRCILNIAGNARDSMETGGSLHIDIYETGDNESITVSFKDTGKGMPPNIRETLFEPFVTYGKKSGSGLGMAITKKIIEAHKGSITVESEEGKGSTFIIKLPKLHKQ